MMNERGTMKPLLISIHLVVCFSSSFSSNSHKVPQTADVEVSERETVNISCCVAEIFQRGRARWYKNGEEIANAWIYLKDEYRKCFTSTSSNFSSQRVDIYTCKIFVEIPNLTELDGNVTIFGGNATKEQRETPTGDLDKGEPPPGKHSFTLIAALAVVLPLILITTICFCWLQKSKASGNTTEEIYDVPHFDSTGTEMDKHSPSSSRGSSQWCQVPLYDSLAYFEKSEKESE
ncbi:hypothetical protein OJAV_G00178600 [Oryzias javanicus]|uniref:Ig-like domain-containing protein n=1 Tax=Oryzias javanicus TaxID=123683 RepID=A0A437CBP2_ORYJA|nr:hypothetical protein OJAV_G00178600 [Oryzias javanicus]